MPSAEQADNPRRRRAEDRIPKSLRTDRPVDAHRKEQNPGQPCLQDRGSLVTSSPQSG